MKDRYQNPVLGDTLRLRLVAYNSNNLADFYAIDSVDIYKIDCAERTCDNPDGSILIETIASDLICHDDTGLYHFHVLLDPKYTIGKYQDVWNVQFREGDALAKVKQEFNIYPDLWYTSPTPAVYSFDFNFTPNRIRKGSKKWIIIQITPNVPRSTDLERYYQNLAISSDLKVSMEQNCGPCVPQEEDLRLVFEDEPVTVRDKTFAYFQIDTEDLDCGIYNIWFTLNYAGSIEVSPKSQIQIY